MSIRSSSSYVFVVKMCTRYSASFSNSRLASSTSRLRMSFLRATTLLTIRERGGKVFGLSPDAPYFQCGIVAKVLI